MGTSVAGEQWAGIIHLTYKSNIASNPDMQNLLSRAEVIQLKHQKHRSALGQSKGNIDCNGSDGINSRNHSKCINSGNNNSIDNSS